MNFLFNYVLMLADDALIIAQRLSEWAYRAPFLEEDIALSNISLDLFGRATLFFNYAASIKGSDSDADDLAFKRQINDSNGSTGTNNPLTALTAL